MLDRRPAVSVAVTSARTASANDPTPASTMHRSVGTAGTGRSSPPRPTGVKNS